jgi:3'-phosphoadenosine 5'-phosphosulfate sulfotransferase (PAPS reductase)/FAD synthetase
MVMPDPFHIGERTCISFSGGRTSGYMLWRVLRANGGLPADAVVCFANTGKEEEATLRFVRDCQLNWGVPIHWLEWRASEEQFQEVTYETASREGEPFEALIRKRKYLPNPITRFCTSELKIRTMHRFLRTIGWFDNEDGWQQFVGIRADEQRRVSKIRERGRSTELVREEMVMPLADAGVTVRDVGAFWSSQPFDLGLASVNGKTLEGNCDLCFLKPPKQRLSLIRARPGRATWWAKMESLGLSDKPLGNVFHVDEPTYAQMLAFARDQGEMFGDDDREPISCFCGD